MALDVPAIQKLSGRHSFLPCLQTVDLSTPLPARLTGANRPPGGQVSACPKPSEEISRNDSVPARGRSQQCPALHRPPHRRGKETFFVERLPPRPHRPDRHPYSSRPKPPSKNTATPSANLLLPPSSWKPPSPSASLRTTGDSTAPAPSKTPSSLSAFRSIPIQTPPTPKSTPP